MFVRLDSAVAATAGCPAGVASEAARVLLPSLPPCLAVIRSQALHPLSTFKSTQRQGVLQRKGMYLFRLAVPNSTKICKYRDNDGTMTFRGKIVAIYNKQLMYDLQGIVQP